MTTVDRREIYTPGYNPQHVGLLQARSLDENLGFAADLIRSGMRVLDLGCGPGSITLDLAARVGPTGGAVGVDVEPGQVETARRAADARGLSQARFEVASAYALPFDDASFDAVTAHTVLQHLRDPADALAEVRRVLRPGGVLAAAEEDWGGILLWPAEAILERSLRRFEAVWRENGGDPRLPRRYRALMRASRFERVKVGARCWTFADAASVEAISQVAVGIFSDPGYLETATRMGLTDDALNRATLEAWRAWGQSPDATMVMPLCEVLAFKPSPR